VPVPEQITGTGLRKSPGQRKAAENWQKIEACPGVPDVPDVPDVPEFLEIDRKMQRIFRATL
jgi:hypothetical protein